MICGRLQDLPCKQTIFVLKSFKSLVFKALKVCVLFSKFQLSFWLCCPVEHNYHVSLFLYFLSHSIVHRALCTISRQTQTARVSQKADSLPQGRTLTLTPLHQWDVYTLSPAYQDTFSKTAGQSQAYYYMLEFRVGDIWRQSSANFNMRSSSVYRGQCNSIGNLDWNWFTDT